MRTAITLALAIGCALGSGACEPPPLRPLASTMCFEPRARSSGSDDAASERIDAPTDAEWIALLTDDEEGPSSSCERALARTSAPLPTCGAAPSSAAPSLRAIPARIVAHGEREGEDDVIWVATQRTADGRFAGPLAIVRRTALGLEVQALGSHLGAADRAELRLLRANAGAVVVVAAERGGERVATLLVQSGGAIVPAALEEPEGACAAPAEIVLRGTRDVAIGEGWTRRETRTAVLDESVRGVIVREHLTVAERDASDPDAPPRATHDADAVRTLAVSGARIRADRPPLVPSVRAEEQTRRRRQRR